jgi:6-phosphogluconolactonase (cycloisomerase 2 family)
MLKSIRWSFWSLVLLALLPTCLAAQEYVYTNNDLPGQNYISGYSVDSNGTVGEIAGSPFSTGAGEKGSGGGFYAANRIIIVNNFLYASNSGSNSVSAFSINLGGTLTPVGSFPIGGFNDSSYGTGISLAATPDGKYLFAGSTGLLGQITIFNINATGGLTMTSKSPVAADGPMSSMKVTPDGKYLLVAIPASKEIAVFAIHGPGNLHQVHSSPYVLSSEPATSLDINCAGNLVFAGGTGDYVYAFNFASGGLSPVAGSPFTTEASSNRVIVLSKDDMTLFSSNQGDNTVTAFAVSDLTGPGTSVQGTSVNASGTTGDNPGPGGLAVSDDGNFLFAADLLGPVSSQSGLSVFGLVSSPFVLDTFKSVSSAAGLESLAAYPAKVCSGAPTAAPVNRP